MADGNGETANRPLRRWRLGFVVALGPLAWGGQFLAGRSPEWTERWYVGEVFPHVARGLRAAFGWAPFSAAEVLIVLLVATAGVRVLRGLGRWRRRERRLANLCLHGSAQTLALASIGYALFVGLWGMNHARLPLADILDLEVGEPTEDELAGLVRDLALRAALERAGRPEDAAGVMRLSAIGLEERITEAFGDVRVPVLREGPRPMIRRPWASRLMSLAWISGIYSPFTGEAHVNGELPEPTVPFTACHEVAHARGFAREDEANFLAWLVCRDSRDADLRYSGALVALGHAARALARVDGERAKELLDGIDEGVARDRAAIREFWTRHDTAIGHMALGVNDFYLRSHGSVDGTRSYGRMVDLMLALRRAER